MRYCFIVLLWGIGDTDAFRAPGSCGRAPSMRRESLRAISSTGTIPEEIGSFLGETACTLLPDKKRPLFTYRNFVGLHAVVRGGLGLLIPEVLLGVAGIQSANDPALQLAVRTMSVLAVLLGGRFFHADFFPGKTDFIWFALWSVWLGSSIYSGVSKGPVVRGIFAWHLLMVTFCGWKYSRGGNGADEWPWQPEKSLQLSLGGASRAVKGAAEEASRTITNKPPGSDNASKEALFFVTALELATWFLLALGSMDSTVGRVFGASASTPTLALSFFAGGIVVNAFCLIQLLLSDSAFESCTQKTVTLFYTGLAVAAWVSGGLSDPIVKSLALWHAFMAVVSTKVSISLSKKQASSPLAMVQGALDQIANSVGHNGPRFDPLD